MSSRHDIGVLYVKHGAAVLRRVRRFFRDPNDAQEITQEIFVRVLDRIDAFRGESSPATWLYQVTTRFCLNRLRDDRRRRELLDGNADALGWGHAISAANQEQVTLLAGLWRTLDAELLEIAVYYHLDGMTHDDIARVMGVSRRTVGNRLVELQERARAAGGEP